MKTITINNDSERSKPSKQFVIFGISLCLLAFTGLVILVLWGASGKSVSSPGRNSTELKAKINFNGSKFVITNNDKFAYLNAKLIVNDKYEATGINIASGENFDVGVLHLYDSDGNSFGLLRKPLKVKLVSENSEGNVSFYIGN
jgi:hypothetical protein